MSILRRVAGAGVGVVLMFVVGMRTVPVAAQQQQMPTAPPQLSTPSSPTPPSLRSMGDEPNPMRDSMQAG